MLVRLLQSYERSLIRRPLTTKVPRPPPPTPIHFVRLLHGRRVCRLASQSVTSAGVSGLGDFTCQAVLEDRKEIDWKRLSIFTFLGGAMVAPALHRWYAFLHRRVPGDTLTVIGQRLLLDQFVFA